MDKRKEKLEPLSTVITDFERRFGVLDKRPADCPTHGAYASSLIERTGNWTGCPDCSREEQTRREVEEVKAERERRIAQRVEALLGRAAIPPRFKDKSFADYRITDERQQQAVAACLDYAEHFPERLEDGRCLLLLGSPGTGKTHLSTAIAGEVIRKHRMSAVYSTVSEAVRQIKDNWTTKLRTESEIIEIFATPDLLVLDEIGMGWGSDTEMLYLFEIINARYQAKKPTILAGNIERDQVRKCVGDRVADRLNECAPRVIVCNWASARV